VTPQRVTITIDELVVEGRLRGSGEDVEAAVRAELEGHPVDAERVAATVASAAEKALVDAEVAT